MTIMEQARRALKETFGYDSFRPGQENVISAILSGREVMAVMPTGAGKSLCYQVPALMLPGITLVVSPLISLMRDQVTALNQSGVRAAYLNSSLTPAQYTKALSNAYAGTYRLIYVAPERLATESFRRFACSVPIAQVVVDEAHCVSQWGQDFRPGYLGIAPFLRALPKRPRVSAFTATATENVRKDIERLLELEHPFEVQTGFDRPNLTFEVRREKDRDAALLRFLREHKGQSGIVYCGTRKGVEETAGMLNANGIAVSSYHAGLGDLPRAQAQEDFVSDKVDVIVATNAFGMGIDKSNVSFVVHYNMPKDIESYYQEAGRAGRDGADAVCCLLYQPGDVRLNQFLIERSVADGEMDEETRKVVKERAQERLKQMTFYATTSGCLRAKILRYFGETVKSERCGNCSYCLAAETEAERDVTKEAQQIVSGVLAMQERFGKALVTSVLAGEKNERVRERNLDKLSCFGCLKAEGTENIRRMIDELVMYDYLSVTEGQYPLLCAGTKARDLLRGDEPVHMNLTGKGAARSARGAKAAKGSGLSPQTEMVFKRLSALRRRIAEEQHVPPFVIFTNATLVDMAMKQPTNRSEMLRVTGVGESKYERYGLRFLRELSRSGEETPDA